MLDFKKLADPEHIAASAREREAAAAAQEATNRRQRAAIRLLTLEDVIYAALARNERDFVRNAQRSLNHLAGLTERKHTWLFDIVKRFGIAFESVPGHYAFQRTGTLVSVHGSGLADQTCHATTEGFRTWASEHGVAESEATAALAALAAPTSQCQDAGPSPDF
jgi:hypothetical protein